MSTLQVDIDEPTERALQQLSQSHGGSVEAVAAKLLARAVRAARPRPHYDTKTLKALYADFAEEDHALAEAGSTERADLLAAEDAA